MLGANIGQDVGRTIFVKDFYFNAVFLDIYTFYIKPTKVQNDECVFDDPKAI